MQNWLLEPGTFRAMAQARAECSDMASAAQWEAAERERETAESSDVRLPRGMSIAGSTAEIRVEGVLTKKPDFFALWFGGGNTTYTSVRSALEIARSNPSVKDVVLHVDSPGGNVDGLFETLDLIAAFRVNSGKKLRVRAENAQSAAYGIAAAAGNIEAVGRGATFGSIGTAVSYYVDPDVVTLTNTDSPDKRPDLTTDEGKAVVVKYLDQLNAEFVRAIAQGRGVDAKTVTQEYGRGASMTAEHAKRLGMIDRIATTAPRAVPSSKGKAMSEEQDNRAALVAAEARGVEQERDRVKAHLTMGESCGDMSIALEAIRSGAGMTLELNARYLSAGMNRSDRSKRQTESNAAEAALKGTDAATPSNATDLGDQVVAALKSSSAERSLIRA
jgi:ClpP class serine protease